MENHYPDMACKCERCGQVENVRIVFIKKYNYSMTLCPKHRREFYKKGLIPEKFLWEKPRKKRKKGV